MMSKKNEEHRGQELKKVALDETMPHQYRSPDMKESKSGTEAPFVNEFGVIIGDSFYDSPQSPLNNWSKDVDPAIMAGDQWVHPTNDIGWNTEENQDLMEGRVLPKGSPFMHPTKDVSYRRD
ncbi:DUF3905 domain-containing protein [Aneurinibacillus tyrosinisolvens]|uniref:DUF3905 domain-containing protein n=1 Tax=Aneurinibacillus tyrosinisolvens TaxID=1443435 RepID=UPI0009E57BB2|nr:DUF3905 domain-containing protein [Aneurinibacillus tyrosinisolvens]